VIEIAQGHLSKDTQKIPQTQQNEIRELYKVILEVNDLSEIDIQKLLQTLQPDSLLERFAYRK